MFSRWLSNARSDQALMVMLVAIGTMRSVVIKQITDSAPAYGASFGSIDSTSSVRNTGGNSPRKRPQTVWILMICSLGVKLSIDESHQTQPAVPTTAKSNHIGRNQRR